jgi:hypothetical protein
MPEVGIMTTKVSKPIMNNAASGFFMSDIIAAGWFVVERDMLNMIEHCHTILYIHIKISR